VGPGLRTALKTLPDLCGTVVLLGVAAQQTGSQLQAANPRSILCFLTFSLTCWLLRLLGFPARVLHFVLLSFLLLGQQPGIGNNRLHWCVVMPAIGASAALSLGTHTRTHSSQLYIGQNRAGRRQHTCPPHAPARCRHQLTAAAAARGAPGQHSRCALTQADPEPRPRPTKLCKTVHGSCVRPPRPPFGSQHNARASSHNQHTRARTTASMCSQETERGDSSSSS
jgi:hypothetical protein